MILLTEELREQLLANGRNPDADHIPVVKFFNPLGEGVWLATELDEDGDTLFGLADLGEPELGSFSLAEMIAVRLPMGLGIERDGFRNDRLAITASFANDESSWAGIYVTSLENGGYPAGVPEPATLALLALGAGALTCRHRRLPPRS